MTVETMPARRKRASQPEPLLNTCGQCDARLEAARITADSNLKIAEAIDKAVATFAPLAHAATDGMDRLDKLCTWLKTRGLLLLVAAPWVLWFMGVISPEAAKKFSDLIKHLGG